MSETRTIPAAGGTGLKLMRGEHLRVIDTEGGQTGDLVAFSADGSERLSNGRSFDYNGKIYLSTGDVLWSDRSNPMLTIVDDETGRHDFLYAACSREMYRRQYGAANDHPNCHDNLSAALREFGIVPAPLPNPFNLFMRADVAPDGRLTIQPPLAQPGSALVLRAEMDLVVALSSCPAGACNGGATPRALAYEILAAEGEGR